MRIAIVNRHLRDGAGGSELQCDLIARGLVARGHDVLHVVASDGDALLDDLPYACVRAADAASIVAHCVAWGADVAYWRMNRLGLPAFVRGCRMAGLPVVLAASSNDDVARWPEERMPGLRSAGVRDLLWELRVRIRHRASYAAVGAVAALTVQRHDFLGRVPTVHQAVVRSLVDERTEAFAWPRPYVAWVASLKRRKRPELLPVLAERLAGHGVDLLVAGALQDAGQARMFEGGGASRNLHHLGVIGQAEVNGLLEGARCVVNTSEEEGFSNVLIHAWWHGTPTVTLEHDPDGLIATHGLGVSARGDLGRLLDGLERYAEDPRSAADAGALAATLARTLFDADANLDVLEELLSDVAGGAAAGR